MLPPGAVTCIMGAKMKDRLDRINASLDEFEPKFLVGLLVLCVAILLTDAQNARKAAQARK